MQSPALPKQAILIVNTGSRIGADSFDHAKSGLTEAGVQLIDAIALEDPSQIGETVERCIGRAPMLIVGGGDGSISSVIDHFVGTETVCAILPLGTANSFARTLGIPLDLDGAIEVIATGRRKRIDLGVIDGDYFANTAALGLSPMIADTVPHNLKRVLGRAGYLMWAIRCAFKFSPFRLIVETPDSRQSCWATEVRIANGRYFGGVELIDSAELDSGEIVIQAVTGKSKLDLGRDWLAALFRHDAGRVKVREFRGREFRIQTMPPVNVAVDGEPAAKTPIKVEVARAVVEVAVPKAEPAG